MNLDQLGVPVAPESFPQKPKTNDFLRALLHVLGERTFYRPHTFVLSLNRNHRCPLKDDVLRLVGLDPDDEKSLPYPLHSKNPAGLYRRIYLIRQQRGTDFTRNRQNPHLFVRGREVTITIKGEKVHATEWGLTERGVAAAVLVRSSFNTSKNATSVWLEGQFQEGLYEKVHERLLHNPQMTIERHFGEIRDHLHHYIADAVRRDSFYAWLIRGDAPTVNQITQWSVRRAASTFRRYSQDPLHRETRGARTKKERIQGGLDRASMVPSMYNEVVQGGVDENDTIEKVLMDSRSAEEALHATAWNEGIGRVREAIRRHKPGAADRYVRVFDQMCDGTPVAEIGQNENVSRNRAASLMAATRGAIRSAAQASDDARILLRYIDSEPFSSQAEIEDEMASPNPVTNEGKALKDIQTRMDFLLQGLVDSLRLREQDGCYVLTERGRGLLREWEVHSDISGYGYRVSI